MRSGREVEGIRALVKNRGARGGRLGRSKGRFALIVSLQIKSREARENRSAKTRSPVAPLENPPKEVSRYVGAYTCA